MKREVNRLVTCSLSGSSSARLGSSYSRRPRNTFEAHYADNESCLRGLKSVNPVLVLDFLHPRQDAP
jgi:hypothetical protein